MNNISVVVPVYNVEPYITRCIDSIIKQSYNSYYLHIVDDGATDQSGVYCDEEALSDNRVIVIHHKNGGLSEARNIGLDLSRKNNDIEWITFIDSDDWIHRDYILYLYQSVLQNRVLISACDYQSVSSIIHDKSTDSVFTKVISPEEFWTEHYGKAIIACGKLYSIKLFSDAKYPIGKIHEDEFTTYKLLFKCKKIAYNQIVLYYYFFNNNSITKGIWTPKQLNLLEALFEQMNYFLINGYNASLMKSLQSYVYLLLHYRNSKYANIRGDINSHANNLRRFIRNNKIDIRKNKKIYQDYLQLIHPLIGRLLCAMLLHSE